MKEYIRKTIRIELNKINEAINLNLSKELSKDWDKDKLDNIFGKNIYRLYYDLDTGKQIFPTKKDPKLKFDVQQNEKLKNDIDNLITNYQYNISDFNSNEAINKKTNQKIRLSKILDKLDKELFERYTLFLDSLKRSVSSDKKLYAMVSRHPHDISTMGTYEKTSSCADISHLKTKKQVERESGGEGVQIILDALDEGSTIIYLIEEGDWNKQHPIARYLLGTLCGLEETPPTWMYGDFNQKFANFIESWISSYNINVHNKKTYDETIFKQDVSELLKLLEQNEPQGYKMRTGIFDVSVGSNFSFLLRGLIKYKRYDVLYEYIKLISPDTFLSFSNSVYGDNIYKNLPDNIKNLFKVSYKDFFDDLNELYNGYIGNLEKSPIIKLFIEGGMDKEKAVGNLIEIYKLIDKFKSINKMNRFNKLFNNEVYNKINALKPTFNKIFKEVGFGFQI
jgi:hypothetical protein